MRGCSRPGSVACVPGAGRHAGRRGWAWPLCAGALLWALIWPTGSEAYVACERSGSTLTVSLTEREDSVRITRGGTRIDVVIAISDMFDAQEQGFALPCAGGTSRVDDTDTIVVEESPGVIAGRVDVDLGGGPSARA